MARLSEIVRGGGEERPQKKPSEPPEARKERAEEGPEGKPREVALGKEPPISQESPRKWEEPPRALTGRCPYLGSRKVRGEAFAYASRRNVCWAEGEEERRLLRTVRYPYTEVAIGHQRTFCLRAYPRCETYKWAEAKK